jgi:hypothetical protein
VLSKIICKASFVRNNLLKSKVFGQVSSSSENQVSICCPIDADYCHIPKAFGVSSDVAVFHDYQSRWIPGQARNDGQIFAFFPLIDMLSKIILDRCDLL